MLHRLRWDWKGSPLSESKGIHKFPRQAQRTRRQLQTKEGAEAFFTCMYIQGKAAGRGEAKRALVDDLIPRKLKDLVKLRFRV